MRDGILEKPVSDHGTLEGLTQFDFTEFVAAISD